MKVQLLFFIGIILWMPFDSYSQIINKKAKRSKYISFLDEGNEFVENGYHYQMEKTPTGKMIYKQFYPSTKQLTHYRTYDKYMAYLDGPSYDWLDNGELWKSGSYEKGISSGEWKFYAWGKVSSYGQLKNGKKEGIWTEVDTLGKIESLFTYKEGIRDGVFQEFDSLGVLENEGIMKAGEIVSQRKEMIEDSLDYEERLPLFGGCEQIKDYEIRKKCADKKMLEFIYSNIKYPKFARRNNISGNAIIQFVIDKDGTITDIRTLRGICKEIEDECIRIIEKFPKWHAGIQRNEPVRVQFNLPIKFRLE